MKRFSTLTIFYSLLTFPLFYFVYKYGDPEPLAHDFFQYYRLYSTWDIDNVNAPFNMRLVGSAIVHLFYKMGCAYPTAITFDKYASWGFDKDVYFCAVLFNSLCVALTCVQIFYTLKRSNCSLLLAFTGGLVYLLGFGTIFYEIMPITDAFSALLFATTLHLYLQKNKLIFLPLLVLVFQREYIFVALGFIALMDSIRQRQMYFYAVTLACIVLFTVYFVLRKTVFYTPALDFQAQPVSFLKNLFMIRLPGFDFFKQTAMTLNLVVIYLLIVIYKVWNKLKIHKEHLLKFTFLFLQVIWFSLAGGHGNNAGRYFYLLAPLVIYYLALEARCLVSDNPSPSRSGKQEVNP